MDRLRYRRRHLLALTWGAGGTLWMLAFWGAAASGSGPALLVVLTCGGCMLYGALRP